MAVEAAMRTCIGCRQRLPRPDLLRVVMGPDGHRVVPDPLGRLAGRGAWVHPQPACVQLAVRRKAFTRALRAAGPLDTDAVQQYVNSPVPRGGGSASNRHGQEAGQKLMSSR